MNDPMRRRDLLAGSLGAAAAAMLPTAAGGSEAPCGPIIDTHVHFYDPARPEGVPWPAKGTPLLDRTVLPDEWERLVAPFGPAGAIVVEASPWVEDNQWLLDLAERQAAAKRPGMLGIVGIVGNLPLEDEKSAALLDRFAQHRRFRGIRVNGDTLLAGLADRGYVARLTRLADHGLTLDVNGGKVFEAVDAVAARFPQLRVVLNHMGNTRVSADGPLPEWRTAIETVARRATVFMKMSALVEAAAHSMTPAKTPLDPAFYEPWLAAAWKAFGDERLMFGSNWPVSDRGAPYAAMFAITAPFVKARGAESQRWFYSGTSRAAYRWE